MIWSFFIPHYKKYLDIIFFDLYYKKYKSIFFTTQNRDSYLQKSIDFKDKKVIKVINGLRRSGKSTLLKLFMDYLRKNGESDNNIVYLNFESLEYGDMNYKSLYNEIKNKINVSKKTYLFFDEIQLIKHWEKAINSLFVDFNVDIYITGSNAYLLSSELATYLSGRYIEIEILPLSFKEFIDFNNFPENTPIDDKFNLYLKYGGLPGLSEFNFNGEQINMVLDGIYSTVIMKDIIQQMPVRKPILLEEIVLFLADNIGSISSPNNIGNVLVKSGTLKKQGKPNSKTI